MRIQPRKPPQIGRCGPTTESALRLLPPEVGH